MQGSFDHGNTGNNDINNKSKLSQNDNGFCANAVTENSEGVTSSCNCLDVHHNDDNCTLILKPCKSVDYAGKSIVHYYLQYTAADVGGHPGDAADGDNAFSIAGHHRSDIVNIDGVARVNKVNTNITNSLLQGSCKSSKCVRVVNIKVDEADMPYIDHMDGIRIISVMNWVKLGETFIELRLIYILPQANSQLKGFYWAEDHASEFIWHLNPWLSVPEGILQVLFFLYAVVDDGYNPSSVNDMEADMYLAYVKDLYCMQTFGYGYTEYMQQVVDQLCQMQVINQAKQIVLSDVSPHGCKETLSVNETTLQFHDGSTVVDDSYPGDDMHKTNVTNKLSDPFEMSLQPSDASHCHSPTCSSELLTLTSDIKDPHKTTGYLAYDPTDFYFVGPDRLPQSIDTVDQDYTKYWSSKL